MTARPHDAWLTVDEVCHAGACIGGVLDWRREFAPNETALPIAEALAWEDEDDEGREEHIVRAVGASGYGYGYGYGYGSGDGDGSGYGYGDGYGDGYGGSVNGGIEDGED